MDVHRQRGSRRTMKNTRPSVPRLVLLAKISLSVASAATTLRTCLVVYTTPSRRGFWRKPKIEIYTWRRVISRAAMIFQLDSAAVKSRNEASYSPSRTRRSCQPLLLLLLLLLLPPSTSTEGCIRIWRKHGEEYNPPPTPWSLCSPSKKKNHTHTHGFALRGGVLCAQRKARRQMVLNMFYLKASEELSPRSWACVLDDGFTCVCPLTPFRSFPPSEVRLGCCW